MEIETMPYFWDRTCFSICIEPTPETIARNPDGNISEAQYRDAVITGIRRWEIAIQKFLRNNFARQLREIQFEIKEQCDGSEDIIIDWWETTFVFNGEIRNGQTFLGIENDRVVQSKFFIAKQRNDRTIFTIEQIESICTHELGHVLGLEHMVGFSTNPFTNDLMITGHGVQPDPRRKISNIDLIVLSAIFDQNSRQDRTRIYPKYIFPYNFWESVEI